MNETQNKKVVHNNDNKDSDVKIDYNEESEDNRYSILDEPIVYDITLKQLATQIDLKTIVDKGSSSNLLHSFTKDTFWKWMSKYIESPSTKGTVFKAFSKAYSYLCTKLKIQHGLFRVSKYI